MKRALAAALVALAPLPVLAEDNAAGPICDLIEAEAEANSLPKPFFARLIWKESRFDVKAVSPVGAQGVAQFMPATAKIRGLADPFDPAQAIPASAAFLKDLREEFGSLGLAAAAYNAGGGRVRGFLAGRGLPAETRDYVFSITGKRAEWFRDNRRKEAPVEALAKDKSFAEACRAMPVIATRATPRPPWGVVVAGGRTRRAAIAAFERARRAAPRQIDGDRLVLVRKSRRSTGPVYTARLGFDSKREAQKACLRLQRLKKTCYLRRN